MTYSAWVEEMDFGSRLRIRPIFYQDPAPQPCAHDRRWIRIARDFTFTPGAYVPQLMMADPQIRIRVFRGDMGARITPPPPPPLREEEEDEKDK